MSPGLTRSQRFQRLMETAGLSVAVVAVTNVVAFGLGAISAIPAIHWCGRQQAAHHLSNHCTCIAFRYVSQFVATLNR